MAERWEEGGMLALPRRRSVVNRAPVVTADDATIAKESSDLLAHLIRNACVNDGTPESGYESRSTDVLAQYLGDTGLDLERYDRAARPREPRRAHRGQRSDRADAAADGPHRRRAGEPRRLAARSVRRRDRRRRDLGPGRGRHAQPHRDDGGRVPRPRALRASRRAARSSTSRSPTRRTSARGAPSTSSSTSATR